jgi:regulator of protease activity HflC (stomatin/prohibitin superfamily)
MSNDNEFIPKWVVFTALGVVAFLIFGVMAGCPVYKVYSSRMDGEAELAQANFSKQVSVQTAIAKNESAKYEAQAEITRAGGVAKANQIIGDSLKNNEAYLRYLFVNNLEHTQNQVIYVPTEAQLPIMEAGKRDEIRQPQK